MESFSIQLQPFFEWLLRTTVKASVLIGLILLVQVMLRGKLSVRWRYCLWLLLLVRLAAPWLPKSSFSIFNLIPELLQPGRVGILSLIWLTGALVLAVYVFASDFNLWRIVKSESLVIEQDILELLEDCKRQMGVRTIVGLVITDKVRSPALFGFVRPRLLLPKGMLEALGRRELRYVFLHELAHLKRHDIYLGWLMSLLQVLHWFNPLIWLAFYRMRANRELACDALVLAHTQSGRAKDYGRTIVSLLERFSRPQPLPSMAGILETKVQLKRRIKMIAKFKKTSRKRSVGAVLVLVALAYVTLTDAYSAPPFIFGTATNLGPTVNSSAIDFYPTISTDGLELYFSSQREGGYGGPGDLWVTTRAKTDDPWGEPVNLGPTVNSPYGDGCPSISSDGLALYFNSNRPGGRGSHDILVTTRVTTEENWGPPANLGSTVNSLYFDASLNISADGLSLYFTSTRNGGYGGGDIWVTTRPTTDDPWSTPVNLGTPVNTSYSDFSPYITPNGLILFFVSDRPGYGSNDIWVSTRPTRDDTWGEPVNLGPTLNTSFVDDSPRFSSDGSTLYFISDRPGGSGGPDLWQVDVVIPQALPDFNWDGKVDFKDFAYLALFWLQEQPSLDIAPPPFGDGIVDSRELAVLGEYWLKEPGLVAHWKLDETEGSVAYDSAGDHDGTLYGDPVWRSVGGKRYRALELDGIDDYVETPFVLNPYYDGPFSAFAWIKGGEPNEVIISQTDGTGLGAAWLCTDPTDGKLMTMLMFPSPALESGFVITDGQWHHIGLVWDGSHRFLYVDGAEVAKDATGIFALLSDGGLYFGAAKTLDAGNFWTGLIDDVRIYDRTLSAEEVAALAD